VDYNDSPPKTAAVARKTRRDIKKVFNESDLPDEESQTI